MKVTKKQPTEPVEQTVDPSKITVFPKPKDRRALSAHRHGLTGQIILLTQADQVAYKKHCDGYFRSFAPVGDVETDLCQACADDRWRLNQAASLASAIFAAEIVGPDDLTCGNEEVDTSLALGRAWVNRCAELERLTLYESRIQRRFEKNLAILQSLQEKRKQDTEQVVNEYEKLAKLAAYNDEEFLPTDFPAAALPGGFVFSPTKIEAVLIHRFKLRQALNIVDEPIEDPDEPAEDAA